MTAVVQPERRVARLRMAATPHRAGLRPTLTAYLQQHLQAFQDGFRHNLALIGPAGSGKSIVLHQVLESAEEHTSIIDCSLQRDSLPAFLKQFLAAVLRAAAGTASGPSLEATLEQARARAPRTTEAIRELLERYATGHVPAEAFTRALDVIPLLHEECSRPCVLVLDEFLHLEDLGLSHAFHELGKRVMTWPFVLFLVTSSSSYRAREILRERFHLLFGQFELVSVPAIEPAAAMAWMQDELPGLQADPEIAQFMLQWIGACPWAIHLLLKRMQERMRLNAERRATTSTLFQAAWDVLGSPEGALYHWCATRLERVLHHPHGLLAREALIAIACGAKTSQAIAKQAGATRHLALALQLLAEHDLVERKGACWVMSDQLMACWVVTILGSHERDGALTRAASKQRFAEALLGMWTHWEHAASQSLAQRIGGLLSRFRNETVSLDSKTGRLPSFDALHSHHPSQGGATYLVADSKERRWCCLVHEGTVEEAGVAAFEQFCRAQHPKPTRKVVVAQAGLELNAKLLAKESNMWLWEPEDVNLLFLLYGQPPLR